MNEQPNPLAQKLNFFVSAFLGVMSVSVASELFLEHDLDDKGDGLVFIILAAYAVWWYLKNPTKKSITPVVLVAVALVIKIAAIFREIKDSQAVGDDIGISIALVVALTVVIFQYLKLKKSQV